MAFSLPTVDQIKSAVPSAASIQAAVPTSVAAGVASASVAVSQAFQSKVGSTLPTIQVKELDPSASFTLPTEGKIVIVGVPGAFTPTCSSQVPAYIASFDEFAAKGVKEIFVIAVNDTFVLQAWSKKLAEEGTKVRFISDDHAAYVSSLGLVFDAAALFGGPRAKRFALVAVDGKIISLDVEDSPGDLKVSSAEAILAKL
ncbi:Redoxin-domain-containing protein [Mrakia frigida]|uniref:thioredoxin peroxidase AHP1 n=1 Tax=Mrakia frigida TaxID=29902 RepID=UPI003FCC1F7F